MTRVTVTGAELDCSVTGEQGPSVVRLHGLTSSRARDRLLGMDVTRALTEHRVLEYDARGHGRSTGRAVPEDYRWSQLAEDAAAVLDAHDMDSGVHGVGVSMGSATLLHLATAQPQRFASLTLALPPTAWGSRRVKATDYAAAARAVELGGLARFQAAAQAVHVRPPAALGPDDTAPEVSEALLPSVYRGAAASDLPAPAELSVLELPVTILAWIDDPTHPTSTAHALHRLIPGSSLHVAQTPADTLAWPELMAQSLERHRATV
ncbi:MAG: alpha/beta hydrolase [Micrococcus sp.]|nr:alpha/beta hydrolase [Micrococcus sp.]